jgi:hypothetical protein
MTLVQSTIRRGSPLTLAVVCQDAAGRPLDIAVRPVVLVTAAKGARVEPSPYRGEFRITCPAAELGDGIEIGVFLGDYASPSHREPLFLYRARVEP